MVTSEWNFSPDPRHFVPRILRKISFLRNHLSAKKKVKLHLRQNWLAHDCYLFLRFLSNRFSIDSMKNVSINNNQEQASIKINFNNLPYFYLAGSFQLALRTTLNQLQTRSKCTQGSNAYQKLKQWNESENSKILWLMIEWISIALKQEWMALSSLILLFFLWSACILI